VIAFTRLHKRAAWPDRIESRRQRSASTATIQRLADTDGRKRIWAKAIARGGAGHGRCEGSERRHDEWRALGRCRDECDRGDRRSPFLRLGRLRERRIAEPAREAEACVSPKAVSRHRERTWPPGELLPTGLPSSTWAHVDAQPMRRVGVCVCSRTAAGHRPRHRVAGLGTRSQLSGGLASFRA
jgi:hypothetical protein